jgi:lysophospholipase L1-like esterase
VIVAVGDSLTAAGWPRLLSQRLEAAGSPREVVNAGIPGNRLLRDGDEPGLYGPRPDFGLSGVTRFESEVLDRPAVRHSIVFEGVNDIGMWGGAESDGYVLEAAHLVDALRGLARRSRDRGVRLFVGTLTPFRVPSETVPGYYSEAKERIRAEVNAWIRSTDEVDAVLDFDRALADPADPGRLAAEYDGGDSIHPSKAGQRALADSIDLALFS